MVDYRRPVDRSNGASSQSPDFDDPWLISDPPKSPPPSEEIALLRQLVAAQKEQVLWSQRVAVVARDIRNAPFLSLVWLLVKLAFAAIPAAIIIGIIWAIVSALFSGVLVAILAALLLSASSAPNPAPSSAPQPGPTAPRVRSTAAPVVAQPRAVVVAPSGPPLTLEELERVRVAAAKAYDWNFQGIEFAGRVVTVTSLVTEALTVDSTIFVILLQKNVPDIFSQADMDELRIVLKLGIKDPYGNPEIIDGIKVIVPSEFYKKVNWKDAAPEQIVDLFNKGADGASIEYHPVVSKALN